MPSATKKAIVASFLQLIGKKPFDKITVRDIVDDCAINRNTFYYYYQDIYAVLEEICQVAIATVPENAALADTLCSFFSTMVGFTKKYPRAARGLALSFGVEGMERFFGKELDRLILACIERDLAERLTSDGQKHTLSIFLRHAVSGFCITMMRDQKKSDPEATCAELFAVLRILLDDARKEKDQGEEI